MMRANTSYFPMPGIVVTEITVALRYAATITPKIILAIGRLVRSAGGILRKPKYMCIMVRMNTTLKNWKILQTMSQPDVLNVMR